MVGVGVIGFGYWGPNLVRNFAAQDGMTVRGVCDRAQSRLNEVGRRYPGLMTTTDPRVLIADPTIDAIAVATPVESHFELGMAALRAGKHVFIEKPIAASSTEAKKLIDEANRRNLVLLVDHTFVYTSAVRKIRELVRDESFGRVQYYDSARVNLGLFQKDVNVLWDLAVHDLSIMDFILGSQPVAVSATGQSHLPNQPENIAFLTVFFNDDLIAHINVNWLSPVKIRRTLVGGSRKMIVYDDLETSEKVKVYEKGITVTETPDEIQKLLISYRTGDLWSPKIAETEALRVEAEHFLKCIQRKETPITGGKEGLMVVRLLEAASQSLGLRGAAVDVQTG